MTPTADQIAFQLATKLSPPGALASAPPSTLRKFWLAIADELVRVYGRIVDLLREAHPATTVEMLTDWEAEFGLPDPCVTITQTTAERRAAVLARVTSAGGSTKSYFTSIAASLGIAISIVEEHPFEVGRDGMGDGIGGDDYAFTWSVTAPAATGAASRELLECVFERLKPAHTEVLFYYV